MCIGKGMICRRGQELPDYEMDSNDHSSILERLKLKDDKLVDRDFVRIELLPLDSLTSSNPNDWQFRVDEESTLPGWFEEIKTKWEQICKETLVKRIIPNWVKNGVGSFLDLQGTQVKEDTIKKELLAKCLF